MSSKQKSQQDPPLTLADHHQTLTPEEIYEAIECQKALLAELEYLKPRDAYIIIQRFYHKRTFVSIAKELGYTKQWVHQTLQRALRRIFHRTQCATLTGGRTAITALRDYWCEGIAGGKHIPLPAPKDLQPIKRRGAQPMTAKKAPIGSSNANLRHRKAKCLLQKNPTISYASFLKIHRVWVTASWFESQKLEFLQAADTPQ